MRTLAAVVILAGLSSPLQAQYQRRYEVGLFGAFTKYDKSFGLADKPGGGVRFAYGFTPMVSLEVEALFQSPYTVAPSTQIEPIIGGGSIIVNALNAARMSVYVLGGYSRLDFGGSSPYRFTDGGVHGGAGAKFFLSSRFALRFEARGIYTPETKSGFAKSATHLVGSAGFAFFQPDVAPRAATGGGGGGAGAGARSIPIRIASLTRLTRAPTHHWAPKSTTMVARATKTVTASSTGSTSAPARPRARPSTRPAAPTIRTAIEYSMGSTSASILPPASRSMNMVALLRRPIPMVTA